MTAIAAENLDRLLTIEIRRPGIIRGFKSALYDIAREAADGPLVLGAAKLLNVEPARIAIVTGAAVPEHMPVGENDGPFGAIVLAAALARIGHGVTILTDAASAGPIRALARRGEVPVAIEELRHGDAGQQEAAAKAADILIAIERLGGNVNGHLYGMTAIARDAFRCNVDLMFRSHMALGRPSLGIGDGGNEIGFGSLHEKLAKRLPQVNQADKTPCGGGVFSTVPTTRLVVASTSNLGAYGVCAGLALLRKDVSLCHAPEEEEALHHVGVGLGLTDGGGGGVIAACDGIPAAANAALVLVMRTIVEKALEPPRMRKF
ncbi:MAG: glutamate cyclase domain-containing protein [Hyphomicrobiales bacterium]